MSIPYLFFFVSLGIIAALEVTIWVLRRYHIKKCSREETDKPDNFRQKPIISLFIALIVAISSFSGFMFFLKYLATNKIYSDFGLQMEPFWWRNMEPIVVVSLILAISILLVMIIVSLVMHLRPAMQRHAITDTRAARVIPRWPLAVPAVAWTLSVVLGIALPYIPMPRLDGSESVSVAYSSRIPHPEDFAGLMRLRSLGRICPVSLEDKDIAALREKLEKECPRRGLVGILDITDVKECPYKNGDQCTFSYSWAARRANSKDLDTYTGDVVARSEFEAQLQLIDSLYARISTQAVTPLPYIPSATPTVNRLVRDGMRAYNQYRVDSIWKAISHFDSAIALDPNVTGAYLCIAHCYNCPASVEIGILSCYT